MGSIEAIIAMVSAGLGVSVVPRLREPLRDAFPVREVDLGPRAPERQIRIDQDPQEIGISYATDIGLVGDARATITVLTAALLQKAPRAADPIRAQVQWAGERKAEMVKDVSFLLEVRTRDDLPMQSTGYWDIANFLEAGNDPARVETSARR